MTKLKTKILWLLAGLIICLSLLYVLFLTNSREQIEKELEKIRATGFPTNCVELDAWYEQVSPDENGAEVVLEAIDQMVTWEDKDTPFENGVSAEMAEQAKAYGFKDVEITDTTSENLPEDWQVKNQNLLPLMNHEIELPGRTESMSQQIKAIVSDYIADNTEALETLHTTTQFSKSRYPVDLSAGISTLMPYLGDIRKCVRTLALETALNCENNKPDKAIESFKAAIAVGRTLKDEPILISQLVKISCDNSALRSLEYLINHTELNLEQLKTIELTLKDSIGQTNIKRALIGERCFGLSAFDDPSGIYSGRGLPIQVKFLKATGLQNKDLLAYLDLMNRQIDSIDKTATEREKIFKKIDSEINTLPWYCISTKMVMPALSKCVKLHYRSQALLQLGRTAATIERYRLDNDNKLPGELTELVPGYLKEVPADPFDQKPIRYIKQGKGYTIYSIGDDLTDNGGKEFGEKGRRLTDGTDITFIVEKSDE